MSVKMSAGTFLRFQENLFCEIAGDFKVIAKFGFCDFSLEGLVLRGQPLIPAGHQTWLAYRCEFYLPL